jgi:hypothetical protein
MKRNWDLWNWACWSGDLRIWRLWLNVPPSRVPYRFHTVEQGVN